MDDATLRYLIPKKMKIPGVPYVIDKASILEITNRLLDGDMTESLKDAFEVYVDACMTYSLRRDTVKSAPATPIYADTLFQSKRLTTFVKRKNNVMALYDRAKNLQTGQVCTWSLAEENVLREPRLVAPAEIVEPKKSDQSNSNERPRRDMEKPTKQKRVRTRIVLDDRLGCETPQTPVRPFHAVELEAQPNRMAFERRNYRGLETV